MALSFAGNQAAERAAGAAITRIPVIPFKIEHALAVYKNISSSWYVNILAKVPAVIRPHDNKDANLRLVLLSIQHIGPTPRMNNIVPQLACIATVSAFQLGYAYRTPLSIGPNVFQTTH